MILQYEIIIYSHALCGFAIDFSKNMYTYQIYDYVFLYFKICYLKYGIEHFFYFMSILNMHFHNTF